MKYMLCIGAHAYLASWSDGTGSMNIPHGATVAPRGTERRNRFNDFDSWFITKSPFFFSSDDIVCRDSYVIRNQDDITKDRGSRMVVKLPLNSEGPYIVFNTGQMYKVAHLMCITGVV